MESQGIGHEVERPPRGPTAYTVESQYNKPNITCMGLFGLIDASLLYGYHVSHWSYSLFEKQPVGG